MVQASSHPDTLRFRLPLFPSYYGNWQIYVTNEIFLLKTPHSLSPPPTHTPPLLNKLSQTWEMGSAEQSPALRERGWD